MTSKIYFWRLYIMELWRNIEEATNYEVSNYGNIRNTKSGQILNPGVAGNGYKQVSLKMKNSNKFEKRYVHRLVATYWIPNPENKREVNHIDLDRTNNCVENLEWITSSDNQKHKYEKGNYKTSNRKVAQMDLDNNIIAIFDSVVQAAQAMGGSRQGIDKVCKGTYGRITAHGFKWKYLD